MKKSRCSILGIENVENQKKMTRPRPPQIQIHNILINIFFNTIITYTTLFVLFTYYFNYLPWYFSTFINLHSKLQCIDIFYLNTILYYQKCLLILKIFSIQIMQSTVIAGKNFKHPKARCELSISGPTRSLGRGQTGTRQDKEGRFNPSGRVSMRQQRSVSALVLCSTAHIHSDPWRTLGVY